MVFINKLVCGFFGASPCRAWTDVCLYTPCNDVGSGYIITAFLVDIKSNK